MSVIRIAGFYGENRALHPKALPDGVGTVSLNQYPGRSDFRPIQAPLTVATAAGAGYQTIYRMGRDAPSDTGVWLGWNTIVHAVRGFISADTTERTYYTGDGVPKWTDNLKYLTAPRPLGVPSPVNAPILTATGGSSTTTETRVYCSTFVTEVGEEGGRSPISAPITCKIDDTVTLSNLDDFPAGNYGTTRRRRIYRSQQSTSGAGSFLFVKEISASLTTTTDAVAAASLGEPIASLTWLPPPADLKYLTGMWNGMMAGITGRSVRFCEAFLPYAWPTTYEIIPTDATPVALATFGQNLLILTTNRPRIVTGGTPDALDDQPIEFKQACVAARSVVSLGHGVVYASPDGLAYVGGSGVKMLTDGVMLREDWQALGPTTIIGTQYEGRYVGFYLKNGVYQGFSIDPRNPQGMFFYDFGYPVTYLDDINDAMYVLDGTAIKKWNAGAVTTAKFRSKVFRMPKPIVGFACAEVVADQYPFLFTLFTDDFRRFDWTVFSRAAFRLPSGYYASDFQVELVTPYAVQGVVLANSMQELAQA
jgi:hypothetical protein